ncbi:hypothetical protein BDN72DRAFT_836925 [Pluteus cervinus]|uniref:Uncharacterized protein n=1 Tax=Pluteus cervinus TaxID=181527 RepID=A0ACD3B1T9_9AGAR|nr:hypothetical protein BDN72DRAFT_836925 [Pluteus cervinus]
MAGSFSQNFMSLFPPTAEDLAVVIGLKEGRSPSGKAWADKAQRAECLRQWITGLRHEDFPVPVFKAIFSEFAAKYLSTVVVRFINSRDPFPAGEFNILLSIREVPHFSRYLRSKHRTAAPGKQLGRIIAERFANALKMHKRRNIVPLPHDYLAQMESLSEIFRFHSMHQEPIPIDARNTILDFLRARDCQSVANPLTKETIRLLSLILQDNPYLEDLPKEVANRLKCRDVCGLPGCDISTNLKTCARCKMICYCCPGHQRVHWSSKSSYPHRLSCFPTKY